MKVTKQTIIIIFMMLIAVAINCETTAEPPSNYGQENAGTEENPFLISNLANLRWLSENPDYWGEAELESIIPLSWVLIKKHYFRQTADIDATETVNWNDGTGFLPIGNEQQQDWEYIFSPFVGDYNGNNYSITGLYFNGSEISYFPYVGLFGYAVFTNIENLKLIDVNFIDHNFNRYAIGTIAGHIMGNISNCSSSGIVSGQSNTGGLIGYIYGDINNSSSSVKVDGRFLTGGLVGDLIGNIIDSYAIGGVTGEQAIGGLVGRGSGVIENCYAIGDVTGGATVGGLAGDFFGIIEKSYAKGNVHQTGEGGASFGGLVGSAMGISGVYGSINNSFATGDVYGGNRTGGLIGFSGSVTIENSYASGNVNGTQDVGGLVGFSNETMIKNSHSSGNVNGSGDTVGGFIGSMMRGSAVNCYSLGNVNGSNYVGGIAGNISQQTTIENCYTSGEVVGENNVGGLVGFFISLPPSLAVHNRIKNVFWDVDISGLLEPMGQYGGNPDSLHVAVVNVFGKTTSEMKQASTYTEYGWDFTNIWDISPNVNDGYPYLRNMPTVSITENTMPKVQSTLFPNYPNPFNPSTTISFNMERTGNVNIDIYNIREQKVKTLISGRFEIGLHKIEWNSTDDNGRSMSSGVYFYQMRSDDFTSTKRMVLMK